MSRSVEMTSTVYGARFATNERLKGEHVLDLGNPPIEPTRIPADWTDTARLRRGEIRDRGGVRNQEKKCLGSRGDARSGGWTLSA